jgi:hypothetical protein
MHRSKARRAPVILKGLGLGGRVPQVSACEPLLLRSACGSPSPPSCAPAGPTTPAGPPACLLMAHAGSCMGWPATKVTLRLHNSSRWALHEECRSTATAVARGRAATRHVSRGVNKRNAFATPHRQPGQSAAAPGAGGGRLLHHSLTVPAAAWPWLRTLHHTAAPAAAAAAMACDSRRWRRGCCGTFAPHHRRTRSRPQPTSRARLHPNPRSSGRRTSSAASAAPAPATASSISTSSSSASTATASRASAAAAAAAATGAAAAGSCQTSAAALPTARAAERAGPARRGRQEAGGGVACVVAQPRQ